MASGTTIARAYMQIIPTTEGIGSDLKKALNGDMIETATEVGNTAGTTMTDEMGTASTSKLGALCSKLGNKLDSTFVGQQISNISGKSGTQLMEGLAAGAIGVCAVAAAKIANSLVSELSEAIDVGAEAEQLIGGVETLFAESSDTVLEYAQKAYKTAGISANDYMEQATSFSASLISGLGGDTASAAEYANLAITDMADNANKMGTSIESIQNAYQGFAKQNYTMLDNLKLGYGGTQEEMIRLINDSGILNETISSLDDVTFDQMIQAIHVIQENLGITGTTSAEAAETVQGSMSSMQAAITNLQSAMALGGDVSEQMAQVIETSFTYTFKNLIPMALEVVSNIPEALGTVASIFATQGMDWLINLADGLSDGIPSAMTSLQDLINSIGTWIVTDGVTLAAKLLVLGGTLIVNIGTGILNSIPALISNFISWIPKAFSKILGYDWLGLGASVIEAMYNGIITMFEPLMSLADSITNGINASIEPLGNMLSNIATLALTGMRTVITQWIPEILTSVTNLYNACVSGISYLPNKFKSIVTNTLTQFISYITNKIPSVTTSAKKIYTAVVNAVSDLPAKLKNYATSMLSKFVSGITSYVSKVTSGIKKVATAVTNGVKSLPTSMKNAGVNLVKGLYQGMSNSLSWIKNKIKSWVGNVTKFLMNLFGINSPSKVTAEMGEYLTQGLGIGIEDTTSNVTDAMDQLVSDTISSAQNLGDYSFSMNSVEIETTATVTTRLTDRINQLENAITAYQNELKSMSVVLDSGTIVGELTPAIDSELGKIQSWKGAY